MWKTSQAQVLAEAASIGEKRKSIDKIVPPRFAKFRTLFEKKASEQFPIQRPWDHAIKIKPDAVLKPSKIYPLNPKEQEKLKEFIQENLAKEYICESKSPMASPFCFVKKKDRALRPTQDYRALNEITIKNAYPLPLIPELIDKLLDTKLFTKLDVRWGFNNIRIKDGDQWKAVFKTNLGLFEPMVMFFGLTNSPAIFQTLMNHLF